MPHKKTKEKTKQLHRIKGTKHKVVDWKNDISKTDSTLAKAIRKSKAENRIPPSNGLPDDIFLELHGVSVDPHSAMLLREFNLDHTIPDELTQDYLRDQHDALINDLEYDRFLKLEHLREDREWRRLRTIPFYKYHVPEIGLTFHVHEQGH